MKTRFAVLASLLSTLAVAGVPNDADLDPTFGLGGMSQAGLTDTSGGAYGPVIQRDGKILICDTRTDNGSSGSDLGVARFNAHGGLDPAFNFNGLVAIDFDGGAGQDTCTGIALQGDGKIVVVGSTRSPTTNSADFAVARLNPDGTLDTTFGAGTGKVVIPFDVGGNEYDEATAVAIQTDGRIVVAGQAGSAGNGTSFAVVRLLPDGTRDTTFNLTGRVTFGFNLPDGNGRDFLQAMAIDGSGRIVLAGFAGHTDGSSDFALARLLSNGQLDANFDADGRATIAFDLGASKNDQLSGLAIQADGRLVVAGGADTSPTSGSPNFDMAVARVLPNGALDATFGIGGRVLVPFDRVANGSDLAYAVAVQPDGKLVLAGYASGERGPSYDELFGAAARLNPDGSLDSGFGMFGKQTYDFGLYAPTGQLLHGIAFQGSQIIVSGGTRVPGGADLGVDNLVLRLGSDRVFADGFE